MSSHNVYHHVFIRPPPYSILLPIYINVYILIYNIPTVIQYGCLQLYLVLVYFISVNVSISAGVISGVGGVNGHLVHVMLKWCFD